MNDGNWVKSGTFEKILQWASRIKWKRLTFSAVVGASVIATEIGSLWESADEGSVGAESNVWDSSSTPKADWDAMVDNYEKGGSEIEHQFEKNMDCLPEQLMVSFYGVFSQFRLSRLTLGPPCALNIGMSQPWGQHEFSSISSMEVWLILFLKLAWWLIIYKTPFPIQA